MVTSRRCRFFSLSFSSKRYAWVRPTISLNEISQPFPMQILHRTFIIWNICCLCFYCAVVPAWSGVESRWLVDADCVIAAIDGSNEFTCHGRASVSVVCFVNYACALFCGRLYSLLLSCIHCDNGWYVHSSCDLSFGVFVLELGVFVHLYIQYIGSCNKNNVVYVHLSFFALKDKVFGTCVTISYYLAYKRSCWQQKRIDPNNTLKNVVERVWGISCHANFENTSNAAYATDTGGTTSHDRRSNVVLQYFYWTHIARMICWWQSVQDSPCDMCDARFTACLYYTSACLSARDVEVLKFHLLRIVVFRWNDT